MSTQVGEIHFDLDLDHKKFSQGVGAVDNDTKTLHKGFSLAKAGAVALAAGMVAAAAGAVAFGVSSVKAYNESLEGSTKLSTNLLNVKGNTDKNVKSIQDLASAMQKKGVIDDDAIVAGAAQLATFGLQGKSIETLTPKIGDMIAQLKGSNATAEDAVGINNLIGKVMTGNVGALSKYGVSLDENQKKQLKNGNEAERAALLVKVLGQNYGDINYELSKTPQGQLTMLKNRFGELQEQVGGVLTKALVPVMSFVMDKIIPSFESLWNTVVMLFSGDFKGGIFGLSEDAPFINAVFTFRETLISIWKWVSTKLWPAFLKLLPTLISIGLTVGKTLVSAFKGLVTLVKWMVNNLDIMIPIVIGLATAFGTYLAVRLWLSAAAAWANAAAFIAMWWPIFAIGLAIAAVVATLIYAYTHWKWFRVAVDTVIKAIGMAAKWLWEKVLQPVFKAIVWFIVNGIIPQFKIMAAVAVWVWDKISAAVMWAWNTVIKPLWEIIGNYIEKYLIPYWTMIWNVVSWVWDKISAAIKWAWDNVIKPTWDAIWGFIQDKLLPIWDKISSAFSTAWNAIWSFASSIVGKIIDIWQTLIDKIKEALIFLGLLDEESEKQKSKANLVPYSEQGLRQQQINSSNPVKTKNVGTGSFNFGNKGATGGFLHGRKVNLVGEEGPELFMPQSSGQIIDAQRTADLLSQGGGNIYLNIDASGIMATSRSHQRQVISTLIEAANEELIGRGLAPIADNKLRAAV